MQLIDTGLKMHSAPAGTICSTSWLLGGVAGETRTLGMPIRHADRRARSVPYGTPRGGPSGALAYQQ